VLDRELTARPGSAALREWDRLVAGTGGSDVVQLSAWAEVRAPLGFEPQYILVRDGGRLVGGAQALRRRLPLLGSLSYVPYGPVISGDADRDRVRGPLLDGLTALARRSRMLVVQPGAGADDVSRDLLARGFRRSALEVAPPATLRLDLTVGEDELRRGMSTRLQRWVRQWPRRGVSVRSGGVEDVAVLADLLAVTAEHQGFEPMPLSYLERLYTRLAPHGNVRLLVGEVDGRPAAAELYTMCGGVVTARLRGFDRAPDSVVLNVSGAVTWEAIRWAASAGYRVLDFGGLHPPALRMVAADPACDPDRFEGPDRYKAKFGGRLAVMPPAVELIPSPAARHLYDLARDHAGGRRLVEAARSALRGGPSRGAGAR
jgi:lipid II:glycine glycyltransferase (peptidoglycan interpeptide bridge formation enzyme)